MRLNKLRKMEEIFIMFPLAREIILNHLDNKSLMKIKETKREVAKSIRGQKFFSQFSGQFDQILHKCNSNSSRVAVHLRETDPICWQSSVGYAKQGSNIPHHRAFYQQRYMQRYAKQI